MRRPRPTRAPLPTPSSSATIQQPSRADGAGDLDSFLAVQHQAGNAALSSLIEGDAGPLGTVGDSPDQALQRAAVGSGTPLPTGVREHMERSFGTDLDAVRLHTGAGASHVTESMGARAVTTGDDIYLPGSAPDPDSAAGQHLLAHELAHVVQQRAGSPAQARGPLTSEPGDRSELAADRAADAVASGGEVPAMAAATAPVQGDWLDAVMAPVGLGALRDLLRGASPEAEPAAEPELETLPSPLYAHSGSRFDALYVPNGPEPAIGDLTVVLKVHVTYQDFTEELKNEEPYSDLELTEEQLADQAWSDADKARFEGGFCGSVASGWSDKYQMVLDETGVAKYRTNVKVQVETVNDPGAAHNKIRALKIPAGLPRFRSFVQGDESTLELRDVDEVETHDIQPFDRIRQVHPFGFDSAEITPELDSQIVEAATMIRQRAGQPGGETGPLPSDTTAKVFVNGRSSTPGAADYNERLARRRAEAVDTRLRALIPSLDTEVLARGETDANEEERFQRVDIALDFDLTREESTQNVAAHEAGHMFGLDDEYVDRELHRLAGDLPEHFEDVGDLMGPEAADELRVQDSHSIMSTGGQVNKGHYVYFLEVLNSMTGKRWKVE